MGIPSFVNTQGNTFLGISYYMSPSHAQLSQVGTLFAAFTLLGYGMPPVLP